MFELVMFDLDGTLVHTAPEIADAADDTLRHFGLPPAGDDLVNGWIGDGARELMVRALDHAGFREAAALRVDKPFMDGVMQQFALAYDEHCGRRSSIYPQVRETLAALRQQRIPIALVTNKEGRLTQRVLEVHALREAFDLVLAGDTLPRSKPDPLPLQHCLEKFGVSADHAVLVGDSRTDVNAAKAAGVPCWAVPYGYNRGRPISEAGPDRIIEDVSAVLSAVATSNPHAAPANTCS